MQHFLHAPQVGAEGLRIIHLLLQESSEATKISEGK